MSAPKKSSRGNAVKETRLVVLAGMGVPKRISLIEDACGCWRNYNPKRDARRQLEQLHGVTTGRQWVRLRRRIRAQYGAKAGL